MDIKKFTVINIKMVVIIGNVGVDTGVGLGVPSAIY